MFASLHKLIRANHKMNTTEQIAQALTASGYSTLDEQAKALGLSRSTAWTIVASKHKMGRLSRKVRSRMLENPELPTKVRDIITSLN
jgi:predicted transcriptional regulator of viral defense system